jgi:NADPH:quinone reductase-like Zn-dependent oxidoreductase
MSPVNKPLGIDQCNCFAMRKAKRELQQYGARRRLVLAGRPADWAVCRGFIPLPPPRGIGFDVSGIVDAVGEGVADLMVGDRVFGVPDYIGYQTAGASDYAIQKVWVPVPEGLDLTQAATLPMAVETATAPLSSRR